MVMKLVAKIVENLVVSVRRQSGNIISHQEIISNLEDRVGQLQYETVRIQVEIEAAKRCGAIVGPLVEQWLTTADELTEEATKFLRDGVEANTGWCPNLKSRYSMSKKAKKITEIVGRLGREGQHIVCLLASPSLGIASTSGSGFMDFASRRSIMNGIMEALKDDSIDMIGLCGIGGVGKTTMVAEVAKRAQEAELFDEVVMVVVSQSPNVMKVQRQMADKLGLELMEGSESERACQLYKRLRSSKRVLVVLDDVWEKLYLFELGISFADGQRGCKILLTTRNEEIFYDMPTETIFKLQVLSEEEGLDLFKEIAGISNDTSHDWHSVQKALTKECGGLPICIITVARELRGKSKLELDNALRRWRGSVGDNITGVAMISRSLELSYSGLESEEAKKCLLLCLLFPEDFSIPINDLVSYAIGLNLLEGIYTIATGRNRVYAIVDHLKHRSLLIDSDREGCIKMHCVVRDFAKSISYRDEHLMQSWDNLERWPEKGIDKNCAAISLQFRDVPEVPENLELPKLELLKLEFDCVCKEHKISLPVGFFGGIKGLKVLALTKICNSSLPTSIQCLTNLRTLSISHCKVNIDLSAVGALEKLEILSIADSSMKELPKEMGRLTQLKSLGLLRCEVLTIPSGVLSSLSMLAELCLGNSIREWGNVEGGVERTEASIVELASLSKLEILDIAADDKYWPRDLDLRKLKNFNISMSSVSTSCDQYFLQKKLILGHLLASYLMESMPLKRTEVLGLTFVEGLKNILCDLDEDGFENLKELTVSHCLEFEYLIDTKNRVPWRAFPMLESLCLRCLTNFKGIICNGQLPGIQFFENLTSLIIKGCGSLRALFSTSLAQSLTKLEVLEITECGVMEAVITEDPTTDHRQVKKYTTMLPQMTSLKLIHLPNLMSFFPQSYSYEGSALKTLEIINCPKMKPFTDGKVVLSQEGELIVTGIEEGTEIWPIPPEVGCVHEVRSMRIQSCGELSRLFPSSLMVQRFGNLVNLKVWWCNSLQVVFSLEGLCVSEESTIPDQLRELELKYLPKLTYIWKTLPQQIHCFQSIKSLKVKRCDSLEYVFTVSMAKVMVKLENLKIGHCEKLEKIISRTEEEENEVVEPETILPSLLEVTFKDLPNLLDFGPDIKDPPCPRRRVRFCPKFMP